MNELRRFVCAQRAIPTPPTVEAAGQAARLVNALPVPSAGSRARAVGQDSGGARAAVTPSGDVSGGPRVPSAGSSSAASARSRARHLEQEVALSEHLLLRAVRPLTTLQRKPDWFQLRYVCVYRLVTTPAPHFPPLRFPPSFLGADRTRQPRAAQVSSLLRHGSWSTRLRLPLKLGSKLYTTC